MKSEKRATKNGGALMKIEIIDMLGTKIEGAFFGESADYWDTKLKEGKIYLFSNGTVKISNKKFTAVKNDFCLIFEKNACIIDAEDDGTIPSQS